MFDFGLAAEMRDCYKGEDGAFHLTPMTGSPRYMSPEVALGKPYDGGCDVYSFALVLWQMLSLKVPYDGHDLESLKKKVWSGPERRPDLKKYPWSTRIKELLRQSWTSDVQQRLSMEYVHQTLKVECVRHRNGDETGLCHNRRRSTFVYRPAPTLARFSFDSIMNLFTSSKKEMDFNHDDGNGNDSSDDSVSIDLMDMNSRSLPFVIEA